MEFDKIKYVLAVADQRSFSKAAEQCFISQPALTRSIGKLEEELEIKLFDRSVSPIRLTYAGEKYVEGLKNIMAMKYQLDRDMEDISSMRRGRLTVGIPDTRTPNWLTRILPPYLEAYPGIDVRIVEDKSAALEQAIVKETVDLAVVTTLPIMIPGIDYEILTDEQIMVVMPGNHPVFNGNRPPDVPNALHYINPRRLHDQPYLSVTPEQGLYRVASQIFEKHGIKPRKVLEIANTSAAFYLASSGMGFTISPVHCAEAEKYLYKPVFCTMDDPPFKRSIIAAYKKDKAVTMAARRFIDITARVISESESLTAPARKVLYDVDTP